MPQDALASMLTKLDDEQLLKLFGDTFTDEVGGPLLEELASRNSPILASELPLQKGAKGVQLLKLYHYEKKGLVESEMVKQGDSLVRKFHITDVGRKVQALRQ